MTEKQKIFADEYLIDLNATRAYLVAYPRVKNENTAAVNGSKLLRNTKDGRIGENFYTMNPDVVRRFVNTAWSDGENFSQKIWKNTDKLANYLNMDIAQGFARGDSYDKMVLEWKIGTNGWRTMRKDMGMDRRKKL